MSICNVPEDDIINEAIASLFPPELDTSQSEKPVFRLGHIGWYLHTKMASAFNEQEDSSNLECSKDSVSNLDNNVKNNMVSMSEGEHGTTTSSALSRMQIKIVDGQKVFLCNECPYKSCIKRSVNRHIEAVHMGMRSFKCPFCEYKANYMSNIKRHITSVHDGDRRFACPKCDYRTSDRGHLSSHIKVVHEKFKPFNCTLCNYHASKRTDLNIHVKTVHNKEKPHKCPYCSYQASKNGNMKRHIRAVHEDPSPCKRQSRRNKVVVNYTDPDYSPIRGDFYADDSLSDDSSSVCPPSSSQLNPELIQEIMSRKENIAKPSDSENSPKGEMVEDPSNSISSNSVTVNLLKSISRQDLINQGLEISLVCKDDKDPMKEETDPLDRL